MLEQYPPDWLVEHFFLETLGVSYDLICDILITSWAGGDALQFEDVEYHIIKASKSRDVFLLALHANKFDLDHV